jgi:hypothetical protein
MGSMRQPQAKVVWSAERHRVRFGVSATAGAEWPTRRVQARASAVVGSWAPCSNALQDSVAPIGEIRGTRPHVARRSCDSAEGRKDIDGHRC